MDWEYEIGATRWKRWTSPSQDFQAYRPHAGWKATAEFCDYHPITGEQLEYAQWWIKETYVGKDNT